MKSNQLTIKTLIHIASLSVITIIILWLLQLVMLEYTYEKYQIKVIKNATKIIEEDQLETIKLEDYADEFNLCIEHFKDNTKTSYNLRSAGCILDEDEYNIKRYKKDLINNKNKKYIELVTTDTKVKSVIYKITLKDGSIILLNTTLEDTNIANTQLKTQFVYVMLLLMIISVIVSIFISKSLNKPILKLINSAKELGKGNYDVKFEKSDIAELDELSDVLSVAATEMKKTDELRRDLIANVSHDLKTPLTMIKAYAEKVKDISYKDKEKMDSDLDIIISESNRLNNLVNDILELSKLESNKLELNFEQYDLIENLNDIIRKFEIVIEENNYKFKLDIPDEAIITADKAKIEQVIYNLINNAIEHTGEDLVVKIKIKKTKDEVELSITDTGKGIPKNEILLVWNRFYTKEKKHRRNINGTGLGLSIVKKILDQHNLKYGIKSKVNEYTTFFVKFHK